MRIALKSVLGVTAIASAIFSTSVALAGWSGLVTVSAVEYGTNAAGASTSYLTFASTPSGKPACGTQPQVIITGTTDQIKALTSGATAGLLSGRQVKVFFDGTCEGAYAKVPYLQLN